MQKFQPLLTGNFSIGTHYHKGNTLGEKIESIMKKFYTKKIANLEL